MKHVYEAEWAVQGWTASEGGLLEGEFPEGPRGTGRCALAQPGGLQTSHR